MSVSLGWANHESPNRRYFNNVLDAEILRRIEAVTVPLGQTKDFELFHPGLSSGFGIDFFEGVRSTPTRLEIGIL